MHADWKIAITVQPTQKFSLCLQTKQRFVIVYRLEKRFCALIISTNLESNDSLTTCGNKNFAGKNLKKELPSLRSRFRFGLAKSPDAPVPRELTQSRPTHSRRVCATGLVRYREDQRR